MKTFRRRRRNQGQNAKRKSNVDAEAKKATSVMDSLTKEKKKFDKLENQESNFVCPKGVDLDECELEIIRKAVEKSEKKLGSRQAQSPEFKKIISILENFLKRKKLICYGGIALNNILPENNQFYNFNEEIPDYDFFSTTPQHDAVELANIYYDQGFQHVEVKAAQHLGTYKVFVNFTGVADITEFPKRMFEVLQSEAIDKKGILYASPNFLRMEIFKELSDVEGNTERFEKIYKRLKLINKFYPIAPINCNKVEYERKMEDPTFRRIIYKTLFNVFASQQVVFMGGFAMKQFLQYIQKDAQKKLKVSLDDDGASNPDFDIIANDPASVMRALKAAFARLSTPLSVQFVRNPPIGEILKENWAIVIGSDAVGFIYTSQACKSYNQIKIPSIDDRNKLVTIKIASIDTLLLYYFIFMFINEDHYDKNRIMCMANFLWEVQQKNRFAQHGILKRFPMTCYGHQRTIEEIKLEKFRLYKKYKYSNPNNPLFRKAFFKYSPYTRRINVKTPSAPAAVAVYSHQPKHTYKREKERKNIFDDEEEEEEGVQGLPDQGRRSPPVESDSIYANIQPSSQESSFPRKRPPQTLSNLVSSPLPFFNQIF